MGVRLGSLAETVPEAAAAFEAHPLAETAESDGATPGMAPQIGHLRSVVGLVWRSVVLWMLLLALLSLANLVG